MTKFREYINNTMDEGIRLIERDCKPYLKMIKEKDFILFRGVKDKVYTWIKKKVRKDRKPLDMDIDVHELLDDSFKRMFGWRARSEGIFVTPDGSWMPGEDSFFFPVGNFKYIWSPDVNDLYMIFNGSKIIRDRNINYQEKVKECMKWLKEWGYTDKNILKNNDSEMVIKCNEYYLVSQEFESKIKKWWD